MEEVEVDRPTGELVLTGDDVESASAAYDTSQSTSNPEPVVELTLKSSGTEKFSAATQELLSTNGVISIWLDNEQISAPKVNAHITDGKAVISGGFTTFAEATSLANLINSGALPFSLSVKSFNTIEPSMGEKSLDLMVAAGIIAFVLVSIFMLVVYRLPGFVAVISLIGQVAGSLAAVSGYFGFIPSFTLTLPGIA